MNNNTKELLPELQELAINSAEISSLLSGIIEMAYLMSEPKNAEDARLLDNVRNGLSGVNKLLKTELTSKLFDLDDYISIQGKTNAK